MTSGANRASLHDQNDSNQDTFQADVLHGLEQDPPMIPPKYFYDEAGSHLFDRICEQPEYYPTRTETAILQQHGAAIGQRLGDRILLIEPGSGSSAKVAMLLEHLPQPAGYVPVEISGEHMLSSLEPLRGRFPELNILPVCADFTARFDVPEPQASARSRVIFFPGSTLGNFPPDDAAELLRRFHEVVGEGGGVLLGLDLRKDPAVLEAAYNDAAGVTAAFNRNLLTRMQQELGADLDSNGFSHRAIWNDSESRIEMHLVSLRQQTIRIADRHFRFEPGAVIVTEYSYKYSQAGISALAERAGLRVEDHWQDEQGWFSVQYLAG